MAPFSTVQFGLLLCTVYVLVDPTPASEYYGSISPYKAQPENSTCPEAVPLRDVRPQSCCQSFLGLHNTIIDCLSKPCIAHCLLQNFRTQKILGSMSMTVSSLIAVAPKLSTHYEQCQSKLFEFVIGNAFDGDFQRTVCDERLEQFFECMVKAWLLDCIGYDVANARCVDLQTAVKSSECSVRSFFTNAGTM
ncbi:uncharacterized protein LOC128712982 [Anopheles marshallii]|uniref:uncharacterized protein LOC128712982 n=1 Tax=Anopheles marshallii TaxID=1521116 RepID=UPI00237A41A5|nr:uncharacterized protein LOC128712982 [Anopheles marshallii]